MGSPPVTDLLETLKKAFADSYNVEEELSGGGMSRLFIATDKELGRKVVIKILPPELTSSMMIARFKRESEVTARLNHPHILPIISAGVRDDLLFYIMPFIEGESLRHRLDRDTAFVVEEAVGILREVSSALAYAHKQGVVHRDIKPENILLQDGHAVLADFGIAAAFANDGPAGGGAKLTRTGMSLGTVGYMAPEQAMGDKNIDGRADIYALGVVGYEMLAGSAPFTGDTTQAIMAAHFTKEPERLEYVRDDVPDEVGAAIRKAMAKNPADRFQTGDEFRSSLALPGSTAINLTRAFRLRKLRKKPKKYLFGIPVAIALAAGLLWYGISNRGKGPVEFVTIAITPFGTVQSDLALWREGMVDVLARNLDGLGPLRTVSPTLSIRGAPSAPDKAWAIELAKRTNAQYAIYGRVVGTANNDVRVRGSLIDVATEKEWTFERDGRTAEAAADSATIAILTQLGTKHQIGAVRQLSLGSSSVNALRAFLQGEQFYRRTSWDSAAVSYDRAIAEDGKFALALRRSSQVIGWLKSKGDTTVRRLKLEAGANNRGLAPRDSLLISADSLSAALSTMVMDSLDWSKARRLFSTLNEAAVHYPDDPEVWFQLGEARFHHGYGSPVNTTERQVLEAFDRSIKLDSSFAPAYVHAVELAYTLDGAPSGQRYARKYLSLKPTAEEAEGIELLTRITSPDGKPSASADSILDAASPLALKHAYYTVRRWPDSAFTALKILDAVGRRPRSSPTYVEDSAWVFNFLVFELAYRGRMGEALLLPGRQPERIFAELATFGMIPRDTARAVFSAWIKDGKPQMYRALTWLAQQGDTTSIAAIIRNADSTQGAAVGLAKRTAQYRAAQTRAYLALAKHDTADALKKFIALPDTLCVTCYFDRLAAARLLSSRGRNAEAANLLKERLYTFITPTEIFIASERSRILERLNRPTEAARDAKLVVDAWGRGDPAVRNAVGDATQRLKRLGLLQQ